jgi:hypothetical protein
MRQPQRRKRAWTKWRKLISQQAKSGQSVAAFCRARGLCAPHFFQWKKRLSQAAGHQFVEVKVAAASMQPVGMGVAIAVQLKNDRRLLVVPGFDAQHLRALLRALENEA